jgi:hypothetical protein
MVAQRDHLLQKLFVYTDMSAYGLYTVQFFKQNKWVKVTVDDNIPTNRLGRPV